MPRENEMQGRARLATLSNAVVHGHALTPAERGAVLAGVPPIQP